MAGGVLLTMLKLVHVDLLLNSTAQSCMLKAICRLSTVQTTKQNIQPYYLHWNMLQSTGTCYTLTIYTCTVTAN